MLIHLSRKIGGIALAKNHKPGPYKVLTFVLWFAFQLIGFIAGMFIMGDTETLLAYFTGLLGAGFGYLIIYLWVTNLPDRNLQGDPQRYDQAGFK